MYTMYERFTDRACKVMQLANQQAHRFNHEYIGTEHLLLGLVKDGTGLAAIVLKNLGIDPRNVRLEVERTICRGPDMITMGKLPQTPAARRALEYATEESKNLNHNYIGTEHLLSGLMREEGGVASVILQHLGLRMQSLRAEIRKHIGTRVPIEDCFYLPSSDPVFTESGRIRSLEQQLWNVRVVMGALVGAIAGALLLAQFGAIMGLLLGGLVAALGWRTLGILTGGVIGALLGCTHLPNDGGGLAGGLLGAVVGFLIAEVGEPSGGWGFLGSWRKR